MRCRIDGVFFAYIFWIYIISVQTKEAAVFRKGRSGMENWWQRPVTSLKGVGTRRAEAFARLEIVTVGDLLDFYPRLDNYIDYSHLATIRELKTDGSRQIFEAEALRAVERYSGSGRRYAVVTVKDETGYAELFLFGAQRFQARRFKAGSRLLVTGRVKPGRAAKAVSEVLLQPCDEDSLDRSVGILPVYNLTESLTQHNLRSAVRQALQLARDNGLPETIPAAISEQYGFLFRGGKQYPLSRKRRALPAGKKAPCL